MEWLLLIVLLLRLTKDYQEKSLPHRTRLGALAGLKGMGTMLQDSLALHVNQRRAANS
ncbi:MAG: hypothetical protein USCGTAYLOR_00960 [Chromatiales bacterium USCg_Taylor]|nr:MAG: hypothetical protein USCGTAYLOR_00960 [Chromatiales bacterium USCg_Taylor]